MSKHFKDDMPCTIPDRVPVISGFDCGAMEFKTIPEPKVLNEDLIQKALEMNPNIEFETQHRRLEPSKTIFTVSVNRSISSIHQGVIEDREKALEYRRRPTIEDFSERQTKAAHKATQTIEKAMKAMQSMHFNMNLKKPETMSKKEQKERKKIVKDENKIAKIAIKFTEIENHLIKAAAFKHNKVFFELDLVHNSDETIERDSILTSEFNELNKRAELKKLLVIADKIGDAIEKMFPEAAEIVKEIENENASK